MVSVSLNPEGHLLELAAVPPQVEKGLEAAAGISTSSNWATLFTAAGLDMKSFTPVNPEWLPLASFDARAAWRGAYPGTDLPLRIEAASWRGRPVNFQMIASWTSPSRMRPVYSTATGQIVAIGIVLAVAMVAALLAWRHLRLKRGDLQGAFRLSAFVFLLHMIDWLCAANHVPDLGEIGALISAVSWALFWAVLSWAVYVALEPYVRRRWPQSMIAWSRLLGGGVHDPVVGGNLLIGIACGVGIAAFFLVHNLMLQAYVSDAGRLELATVMSARQAASQMVFQMVSRIGLALAAFFVLFLLRSIVRKQWIAVAVFAILLVQGTPRSVTHPLMGVALNLVGPVLVALITVRFGLLAMMASFFTTDMLIVFPATTHLSAWYAGSTLFAYAVVLALGGYAFHTAVAGRPLFTGEFLDAD
jgi:serine/threonine-protein kinase